MAFFQKIFSSFSKPDWEQGARKSKDGWISNFDPISRRYLTPTEDNLSLDDRRHTRGTEEVGVQSTAVEGYSYDPKTQDLWVQFKGGNKSYCYPNVPRDVVQDFGNAPSKGRFVADVLKPEYSVATN